MCRSERVSEHVYWIVVRWLLSLQEQEREAREIGRMLYSVEVPRERLDLYLKETCTMATTEPNKEETLSFTWHGWDQSDTLHLQFYSVTFTEDFGVFKQGNTFAIASAWTTAKVLFVRTTQKAA